MIFKLFQKFLCSLIICCQLGPFVAALLQKCGVYYTESAHSVRLSLSRITRIDYSSRRRAGPYFGLRATQISPDPLKSGNKNR